MKALDKYILSSCIWLSFELDFKLRVGLSLSVFPLAHKRWQIAARHSLSLSDTVSLTNAAGPRHGEGAATRSMAGTRHRSRWLSRALGAGWFYEEVRGRW